MLNKAVLKDLAEPGTPEYVRWQNVKRGRARMTTEEIESLATLYPHYRWWLISGNVMPDFGQTSPEYDEAHKNLINQNAG